MWTLSLLLVNAVRQFNLSPIHTLCLMKTLIKYKIHVHSDVPQYGLFISPKIIRLCLWHLACFRISYRCSADHRRPPSFNQTPAHDADLWLVIQNVCVAALSCGSFKETYCRWNHTGQNCRGFSLSGIVSCQQRLLGILTVNAQAEFIPLKWIWMLELFSCSEIWQAIIKSFSLVHSSGCVNYCTVDPRAAQCQTVASLCWPNRFKFSLPHLQRRSRCAICEYIIMPVHLPNALYIAQI